MPYAPVSKEFGCLHNKNIKDYANFMNLILLPDSFDPSKNYENFPSHIYDELPNDLFDYYLKFIISKKETLQEKRTEYKILDSFKKQFVEYDTVKFQQKNETLLIKIIYQLLSKTPLSSKWNYKLQALFVTEIKKDENSELVYCSLKFCLHRPSRAFGKIIKIEFIYDFKKNEVNVIDCSLYGIVPQEYIYNISGITPDESVYFLS